MSKTRKTIILEGEEIEIYKGRSMAQETWRRLKRNKGAMIGIIFLVALMLATTVASFVYDYDKDIIAMSKDRFMPPSKDHILGTDNMGRDIFARVLYGAKYSLVISLGSTAIGLAVGLFLGALAGYYGGLIDNIVMRVTDIFYSIPYIMIAVVVVSMLGTSTMNLLLAMALGTFSNFARIGRASVMTVRDQEFIEAGRAIGLPTWKTIVKHVLPNCLSPIIVQTTLKVGSNIISASSLSFLGVGVTPPTPEWGAMLSDGRSYIRSSGWMCLFPGLAIMFTVLALNLLGDGLRDAMDPKLKR
ncbi:MAG: ABC transporter permease [Sphaerochaetaceae bacterium]|jgi:peptide/nickel transport system permease protein|nr:ABC transporter permease [Sphaerochaetaceae bacterium]